MPQIAIAIAEYLVAAGVSVSVAYGVAIAVVNVFIYAAVYELINLAVKAVTPGTKSGAGSGMEANYYNSAAYIRIVYGEVRTGGMETIPAITSAGDGRYLSRVLALAGHPCDSFSDTYFDDQVIDTSFITSVVGATSDGRVTAGKYQDRAWIRRYDGRQTTPDFKLKFEVSQPSFSDFVGRDITYAALMFQFERSVYTSIPQCTFKFRGARCYDPRLDSTNGGSGSHRYTNSATWAWTNNVALVTADYLMATYGGEYDPATEIDWPSVITAANICDALVPVPVGATQKRFTFNGVLIAGSTSDQFQENMKQLANAMLGRIAYTDAIWHLYAGSWQTPVTAIAANDWVSGLVFQLDGGRKRRFNRMRCWYVDPARNWQRNECMPRDNAAYMAADGNEWIDAETDQPACTNEYEAQRKAEVLLRQSRNQVIVSGKLPPRLQGIRLWEPVTVTLPALGWVTKTFRVTTATLNPDGSLDVALSEEQAADWNDLAEAEYDAPSTSTIPAMNPTAPSEPASFAITPNVNGTLTFKIGKSIVEPYGTQYRVVRSLTDNAAVGTIVYDGVGLNADLAMPTSAHYYWTQAHAGSYVSAYTPTSHGLTATAVNVDPGVALIARGQCVATGSTLYKQGGVQGFDSDVYSAATYQGGVRLSFRPLTVGLLFMVGLNSDPTTDQNYTSLDYAWYAQLGVCFIYESGVNFGVYGAYTTATVFEIRYDGQVVRYYKDGVLVRSVTDPLRTFFLDSSFYDPGASCLILEYGSLATVSSVPFVTTGDCVVTDDTIRCTVVESNWGFAQAYSSNAYKNGAYVSFQVAQVGDYMIGLNTDPTLDASYTSIDFAWYVAGSGLCYLYESGSLGLLIGGYSTNDIFAIAYDGKVVRYLLNGSLIRETLKADQTFYLDSAFVSGGARNVVFTPFGTATPTAFIARGNCVTHDSTMMKLASAPAGWDSDVISVNGYQICHLRFKSDPTVNIMAGFNADPYTDQSYTSLDAAWYPSADGNAYIYESGVQILSAGAYTAATVFDMTYDGANVRYYKDGVLIRAVGGVVPLFYFDSSFYTPGAGINSVEFGPGLLAGYVDTAQIGQNAATDILIATASAVTISAIQHTPDGQGFNTQIVSIAMTPKVTGSVLVTVAGFVAYTEGGALGTIDLQYSLQQDAAYDGLQEQHYYADHLAAGTTQMVNVAGSRIFSVVKDVVTTFKFMAAKFSGGDNVNANNIEIRTEAIKR